MQILIAHSEAAQDREVAFSIAQYLRDRGHNAHAGDELYGRAAGPHPANRMTFWYFSIADPFVEDFFRKSDAMIAVSLGAKPPAHNVTFELGSFLYRDRDLPHTLPVVLLRSPNSEIPEFLTRHKAVTDLVVDDPKNSFRLLAPHLERIQELFKKRRKQVFLSYASCDIEVVDPLYRRLTDDGYNVWFDRAKLVIGEDWDSKIIRAIRDSIAFIACFSDSSVGKRGYFQVELRRSLGVAEEYPEGSLFILPLRLNNCEVPENFKKYHWCDYTRTDAYAALTAAIDQALYDDATREAAE